jgi:hypothetical protein
VVARTYTSLPPIVDKWFQFLFHSPSGVLFTFPSRYLFTIGHQEVFSLTQWSGQIPTKFHVLRGTWENILLLCLTFHLQDCHFLWSSFPEHSVMVNSNNPRSVSLSRMYPATPTPQRTQAITWHRFWLFPFRSPLLRESLRFLFLALLRCFSSCRSPSYPIDSDKNILGLPRWVSPFGNLRIKACLTAPRSFWQSTASFIVSWCQGIHQMPFSINRKFVFPNSRILNLQIFQRSQET